MAASIPALVNPPLLVWAREQSGFAPQQVARKLGLSSPTRLDAWEKGDRKPTIRQAQKLAAIYRRPLGLFYLPMPPALPPLATKYRRLSGVRPGSESPELRLALRQMSHRREIAVELVPELGQRQEPFALEAKLGENPELVGAHLRSALGIAVASQVEWANEYRAWRGVPRSRNGECWCSSSRRSPLGWTPASTRRRSSVCGRPLQRVSAESTPDERLFAYAERARSAPDSAEQVQRGCLDGRRKRLR